MVTAIHHPDLYGSEERFLCFAAHRDVAALERLLVDHLPQARATAYRLLGNAADADDAIQEALVRLVKTADRYDGAVPFAAWLGQLVRAAALQLRRSTVLRAGRERHPLLDLDAPLDDREQLSEELAAALRAAVASLPERYRAPIELHYFAQLSQEETALALGLKEDAVAQRMHRGRERLRATLRRHGVTLGVTALLALLEGRTFASEAAPVPAQAAAEAACRALHAARRGGSRFTAVALAATACAMLGFGLAAWWHRTTGAAPTAHVAPLLASTVSDLPAAPAGGPRSRTWDFAQREPTGVTVTAGTWHPVLDHGTPCMETASDEFHALLDIAGLTPPLRIGMRCSPRLPVPQNPDRRYRVRFDWAPYVEAAWLNDVDPDIVVDGLAPGTDFIPFYRLEQDLSREASELRIAEQRSLVLFCNPAPDAQLALNISGRFRLADLRIEEIGPGDLADLAAYHRSVEAIPPQRRRGTLPLDLALSATGQQPSVTFWHAGRDGAFPAYP